MKDIDFDELDKAVNSLMSSSQQLDSNDSSEPVVQAESASPSPAPVTTPTIVNTSAADTPAPTPAAPIVNAPVEQAPAALPTQPLQQAVPVRQAAPAVKRGGRFMDMVSTPSADQRPARTAPPAVPTTTSREGLSITPRDESVSFESQQTTPAEPVVATPDPITIADVAPSSVEQVPAVQAEPAASDPIDAQPVTPLESPFLADAKVEKRPLNSGSAEVPLVDLAAALEEDSDESQPKTVIDAPNEVAGANGDDEPPITPQVAELDSDLVAIESSENVQETQATETTDAAKEVPAPSTPIGASSIPQQYTSQPSSGDQSHAAIYDASQYPEPVAHPGKSKSGWLWVLWVILLLGVGAGGAVVLYNLGIIP